MIQRAMEKKHSGQGGFTLIELLIVIVILGILAAIVVLAVGGLSDSSQSSSCNAEKVTIETAEDAYYATNDRTYATVPGLFAAGLLKTDPSGWWQANATTGVVTPVALGKCA